MKNLFHNILSIAHLRSIEEFIFNLIITSFSFILGYSQLIVLDNSNLFMGVVVVVVSDWVMGTILALKNKVWHTRKAIKIVYYIFAYSTILFTVLAVEKAHPSAFFLSETIIMPILVFQIISTLKNASLIGFIPQGLLLNILNNIDSYKNASIKNENA